jgi:hypothetical protein
MFSTSGPIVQRISKSMFVVKCKTSSQHPLGYLHLTIFNNVKHKDKPDYRHYCACPVEYKVEDWTVGGPKRGLIFIDFQLIIGKKTPLFLYCQCLRLLY